MLVSLWPLFEPIKAIAETILTNDALAPAISHLFYTLFPPLKANSFPKRGYVIGDWSKMSIHHLSIGSQLEPSFA